jgi:hypothetical protein
VKEYINHRLGKPEGPWPAVRKMINRSFGARSFTAFWHYWNPVYGYYLYYWFYRPLRRFMPRPAALLLTFAVCGFLLHDLPHLPFSGVPLITLWFLLLGAGVIISEALSMDLSRQSFIVRATVNVLYLAGSFEGGRRIALWLFRG